MEAQNATSNSAQQHPIVMQVAGQNGQHVLQTVNGQQIVLQTLGAGGAATAATTGGATTAPQLQLAGNSAIQIIPVQNVQQAVSAGGATTAVSTQQQQQQLVIQQQAPPQQHLLQTADGQTIVLQPLQLDGVAGGVHAAAQQAQSMSVQNGAGGGAAAAAGAGQVIMLMPGGGATLANTTAAAQLQRVQMPTPEVLEEEPLYVNAKQYHRILKRRQARARLEADGRVPKERRKYLHESRHRHALNRMRGEGGRFGTTDCDTPIITTTDHHTRRSATVTPSGGANLNSNSTVKFEATTVSR